MSVLGRPRPAWLAPLVVALVALAAHAGNLGNGFTNWDDPGYILDNPLIRHFGLRPAAHLFTRFYYNDYYPLNQLSYMVDHAVWGLDPRGYHLSNMALHAVSAVLAFLVARRLLGGVGAPFVAALGFAVHPVNVESVAWLSERKNVLSMVFFLASFLAYLERDRRPGRARLLLGASLLAFGAAALSKTIVTPYPLLLVSYDLLFAPRLWRRRLLEKVPFLAVSAVTALLTVVSQGQAGAIPPYVGGSFLNNIWTLLGVYLTYLRLLLLPIGLSARYRSPYLHTWLEPRVLLGLAVVLALLYVAYRYRGRLPLLSFAILWFFLTLLPVSHIIPTSVLYADRYLYYPSLAFAWLVAEGLRRLAAGRRAAAVALGALLLTGWTGATLRRTADWHDSIRLWQAAVRVDPDNFFAHALLGDAYLRADRLDEAIRHKELGLSLAPDWRHTHIELTNTGFLHYAKGNLDRAEELLRRARDADARYGLAWKGLGLVALERKRYGSGAYFLLAAYANGTRDERVLEGLESCWRQLGQEQRWARFQADPDGALRLEAEPHLEEGRRLQAAGDLRTALAHMLMASRLVPGDQALREAIARLDAERSKKGSATPGRR